MTTQTFIPTDPRLGRHVQHDPRSLRFAAGVLPRSAIKTVAWTRRVAPFDQGDLGSCVGNAAVGLLATDCAARQGLTHLADGTPIDEALAVKVYSLATTLDEFSGKYPPVDSGTSGLGGAKALKALGLASSYSHAFSLDAMKSALQTGPVMVGTSWYQSMYEPDGEGFLKVDQRSGVAGGHEWEVYAYNADAGVFGMVNSWGTSWGVGGGAYVREADMLTLLADQGDVTVPTWVTSSPPPDTDDSALVQVYEKFRDVVVNFEQVLEQWAKNKHLL